MQSFTNTYIPIGDTYPELVALEQAYLQALPRATVIAEALEEFELRKSQRVDDHSHTSWMLREVPYESAFLRLWKESRETRGLLDALIAAFAPLRAEDSKYRHSSIRPECIVQNNLGTAARLQQHLAQLLKTVESLEQPRMDATYQAFKIALEGEERFAVLYSLGFGPHERAENEMQAVTIAVARQRANYFMSETVTGNARIFDVQTGCTVAEELLIEERRPWPIDKAKKVLASVSNDQLTAYAAFSLIHAQDRLHAGVEIGGIKNLARVELELLEKRTTGVCRCGYHRLIVATRGTNETECHSGCCR